MILRFLGVQGAAGLAVSLCLAALLVIQKGETRHWKRQSGQFEQLYRTEQAALAGTVANYKAAAEAARAADRAAAQRVAAEQRAINERTAYDFETRLADARARAAAAAAEQLRIQSKGAAADPGAGRAAPVPGLSVAAGGTAQGAEQGRLPRPHRLIATEQAIQLDELVKWVRRQHAVDPNAGAAPHPQ
jgi:hypothetical protein